MLAHGHPDAWDYPIGRVQDEAWIIEKRKADDLAALAVVIQAATGTTGMTASTESQKHFERLVKQLNGDD